VNNPLAKTAKCDKKSVHFSVSFVMSPTSCPSLADYTRLLTPLTHKSTDVNFPPWMVEHQTAFDAIKSLVIGVDCLTTIDHDEHGENQIFVTCDASNKRKGRPEFGLTWESACPVAFDSMALKDTQLNYPVHEKELLAIIRALQTGALTC